MVEKNIMKSNGRIYPGAITVLSEDIRNLKKTKKILNFKKFL